MAFAAVQSSRPGDERTGTRERLYPSGLVQLSTLAIVCCIRRCVLPNKAVRGRGFGRCGVVLGPLDAMLLATATSRSPKEDYVRALTVLPRLMFALRAGIGMSSVVNFEPGLAGYATEETKNNHC